MKIPKNLSEAEQKKLNTFLEKLAEDRLYTVRNQLDRATEKHFQNANGREIHLKEFAAGFLAALADEDIITTKQMEKLLKDYIAQRDNLEKFLVDKKK